jgi:hypothetical protein
MTWRWQPAAWNALLLDPGLRRGGAGLQSFRVVPLYLPSRNASSNGLRLWISLEDDDNTGDE